MKFTAHREHQISNAERRMSGAPASLDVGCSMLDVRCSSLPRSAGRAFTMIEVALCLAIISFALMAIIGVLPRGMNTQRDNREETIIGQDATLLLEAIRSGSHGADDLTNYVIAITNNWTGYDTNGIPTSSGINGYTTNSASLSGNSKPYYSLTNGLHIIGLLSTPEFTDTNGNSISSLNFGGFSNRITAYMRSMSGLAAEKPPQNNDIMIADTFSYRLLCVNAPMAVDTNNIPLTGFSKQLAGNQRELRMTFRWPLLPNGAVGNHGSSPQTFRTTIAGQLAQDANGFYFYQPQSFTNAP
jgi:type II secretory pathway pseudopilin PulG